MKVAELLDYLTKCVDRGKTDAEVATARKSWNPITESEDISDAITLEWQNGESRVVLLFD